MIDAKAINTLNSLKQYYNDKNEDSYVGFDDEDNEALEMAIKALKQTRWIPVSERLPEKAFGCLVTVEEDDINGEPQRVLYPEFVGYDDETWNDAEGLPIPFEVIAWMPLPQPYTESEDAK